MRTLAFAVLMAAIAGCGNAPATSESAGPSMTYGGKLAKKEAEDKAEEQALISHIEKETGIRAIKALSGGLTRIIHVDGSGLDKSGANKSLEAMYAWCVKDVYATKVADDDRGSPMIGVFVWRDHPTAEQLKEPKGARMVMATSMLADSLEFKDATKADEWEVVKE